MLIRKKFSFENAHVVRNCTSDRCSRSIHGHSYKVEVLLEAHSLDNGQMIYDFGLMKGTIKDIIDSFDHAIAFWDKDDAAYIESCKTFSARWISLPVSPSAEQFSRLIFVLVDAILHNTVMNNNEPEVTLHSIIVHETETGYAQAFRGDAVNARMGLIPLEYIVFSEQIRSEWNDPTMYHKLLSRERFINPKARQQVAIEKP